MERDIHVQYAVVSIAVYGRLQHLTKTWSCPKMLKVAHFPYVKYSKLSHMTYFRTFTSNDSLSYCLPLLSRRIRLYPLDFGVFLLFCS